MKNDSQVTPVEAIAKFRSNHPINDLLIGDTLEENLFKLQQLLAVIQQGFTPPFTDIPMKEATMAGLDLLLEYAQQLLELEIQRIEVE
ncbi:hypothetical protein [Pleionea sp. CnH1-48]|uniref:hypothetical protein n=1 Tax=Pleionea sp. CnH1-48 TaxID=2954494 RepID=UPI002097FE96|nr:hypothetical protein [Pleionea sp. CnH1-48]MCO7223762.1 hypothetical protein [Pleionea sp. CnH1-48]